MMDRAAAKHAAAPLGTVGRYQLLELVGEGGHGKVYRAVDPATQAVVAIKVLHEGMRDADLEMRMKREAYAMGQLAGTCATKIHECAETEKGQVYLAMEFLEGKGLDKLVESEGGRLPLARTIALLDPVVATLEVAHARGIIHRDLKPANIFVQRDGSVRLVDFGLMRHMSLAKLTEVGVVPGSPAYVAPEAWAGDSSRIDHRIDVYALGVTAFRILSGKRPFEHGADQSIMDFIKVVTTAPRPSLRAVCPELPPAIDDWTKRALAIRRDDRFQTVTVMWDALKSLA